VLRGTSLLESSNIKNRHDLIGGHRKWVKEEWKSGHHFQPYQNKMHL
jgi:hypothetical protein